MSPSPRHLDDQTLVGLLESNQITHADETHHLDSCRACQQRLDQLARDDSNADQICQALRSEQRSLRSLSRIGSHPTDQSLSDFVVGFLQPSDASGAIGRLNEFEIFGVIGSGGMGVVLKGFQPELNRPVAIKVMAPHLATLGVARQRFVREAQASAAITHPNVMPVLSVGEANHLPFLVMPYLTCHSLQHRIDAEGMLPVVDTLRIGHQVAAGLAAAHAQGLVHRDVKPANILLERGVDRALLTDFGLARAADDVAVTRSGIIAGTPQYMSPQQAQGLPIDARSDLFSLGSTLIAMATARPAFDGSTTYAVIHAITQHHPPSLRHENPEIPEWLDRYILTLIEKDPANRPPDAGTVAATLEKALAHVQQPTAFALPSVMTPAQPRHWRRQKHIASLLTLFAAAIVIAATWRNATRPTKTTPVPTQQPSVSEHAPKVTPSRSIDQELDRLENRLRDFQSEFEPSN